jgi:hypothetical protein
MSPQIRDDEATAGGIARKNVPPVVADAHAAMEQEQRLAGAAIFEAYVESVEGGGRHVRHVTARALTCSSGML